MGLRHSLVLLAAALPVFADPHTARLLVRLAADAAAFENVAPELVAMETLRQRAQKPTPHGIHRAQTLPGPVWQTREILSEYTFTAAGSPASLHELRRIVEIDGKRTATSDHAERDLIESIGATGVRARRRLLEQFEKNGLVGTVTDFGQILLLFRGDRQAMYEFSRGGQRLLGAEMCEVFAYSQVDGPGSLVIYDAKGSMQPRASGEIWVSRDNYRLARITLKSVRGESPAALRDDAQVDYDQSTHGVPVPAAVTHREYRNGQLAAENVFTYSGFRRLGVHGTGVVPASRK